jgi:methyl-accepting chemotaxis protein
VDSWRERLLADHVASLATLGSDESRYSDEPPLGQAQSWRQRWRRWRRQVLAPAAWPLAARLVPALLLAALLPLAAFGWMAVDSLQLLQDQARRADAAQRAQAAAVRRAEGRQVVRSLAAEPELAQWLQARDEAGLARLQTRLQARLQAARQADPDLQSLMLADTVGDLRAGTDPPRLGRSELTRADLRQALAGREAEAVDAAGPAGGVALAAPVRDSAGAVWGALLVQWRPATVAPPDPDAGGDDPLARLLTALQLALAGAVLLALVLGLRLARSVSRPVQALTAATQALRVGRFDHSYVDTKARGELRQLVRSFNVAVDVLRQRERERETRRRS